MYYIGKYFDTFEMALEQLLYAGHCRPIPFIDCLCLRCFGFRTEGAVETWFQPYVSLPASMQAFSAAVGLQMNCKEIQTLNQLPGGCGEALLGPVTEGITAPEIQSYYYRAGTYLFLRRCSSTEWMVYDPRGWPGLPLPQKLLDRLIPPCGTFCIWLAGPGGGTPANPRDILARGLAYHRRIAEDEDRQLTRACGGYEPGRKNDLSLRYAVWNLLQRMDKVFTLATACGWDVETRYQAEKQPLFFVGPSDPMTLQEAILNMWRILDDG